MCCPIKTCIISVIRTVHHGLTLINCVTMLRGTHFRHIGKGPTHHLMFSELLSQVLDLILKLLGLFLQHGVLLN